MSIIVVGYFIFLYLNVHILHIDNFLVSIISEIMIMPMLVSELILFLLSMTQSIIDKFKINNYSFWTSIILLISIIFTWGSLIIDGVI